jgi:hypothetical protein
LSVDFTRYWFNCSVQRTCPRSEWISKSNVQKSSIRTTLDFFLFFYYSVQNPKLDRIIYGSQVLDHLLIVFFIDIGDHVANVLIGL